MTGAGSAMRRGPAFMGVLAFLIGAVACGDSGREDSAGRRHTEDESAHHDHVAGHEGFSRGEIPAPDDLDGALEMIRVAAAAVAAADGEEALDDAGAHLVDVVAIATGFLEGVEAVEPADQARLDGAVGNLGLLADRVHDAAHEGRLAAVQGLLGQLDSVLAMVSDFTGASSPVGPDAAPELEASDA